MQTKGACLLEIFLRGQPGASYPLLIKLRANGLGENRLQQFGFCIGAILIWWKIVFLAINPV